MGQEESFDKIAYPAAKGNLALPHRLSGRGRDHIKSVRMQPDSMLVPAPPIR